MAFGCAVVGAGATVVDGSVIVLPDEDGLCELDVLAHGCTQFGDRHELPWAVRYRDRAGAEQVDACKQGKSINRYDSAKSKGTFRLRDWARQTYLPRGQVTTNSPTNSQQRRQSSLSPNPFERLQMCFKRITYFAS